MFAGSSKRVLPGFTLSLGTISLLSVCFARRSARW